MERVEVTQVFIGICHMQVCAEKNATDEEILAICNRENPSGTTAGWAYVLRADEEWCEETLNSAPVTCQEHPKRLHFLVAC